MKRRIEIHDRDKYISKEYADMEESEDLKRWYEKFGKPQQRTMPADEFMARLKEMIEFE